MTAVASRSQTTSCLSGVLSRYNGKHVKAAPACSASYAFERVHRLSVEAAMRHMPLLQCIGLLPTYCTLISEDPTSQPFPVIYYVDKVHL